MQETMNEMQKTIDDISSTKCKEILNNGNIMEYPDLSKGQQFWVIIYNYKEYFVEKYQETRKVGNCELELAIVWICVRAGYTSMKT